MSGCEPEVVLSADRIEREVRSLAAQISVDYAGLNPVVVGVLRGAFVFMADLVRAMTIPCEVDFMTVSSYGHRLESAGRIEIRRMPDTDLSGRHVILVDDVIDSALTLGELIGLLGSHGASSVEACVLLRKQRENVPDVDVKYLGFDVADRFLVGYGMDAGQRFRHLPFVGVAPCE